jgi:hypothetical protein
MGFRWKLIVAFAALFVIGGFCGSALTLGVLKSRFPRLVLRNGRNWEEKLMTNLTKSLKLSSEQQAQIKPQIAATFQQMRTLRHQVMLQSNDIIDQTLQRIESQLNPDQQQRLERFRARRRERIQHVLEESKR